MLENAMLEVELIFVLLKINGWYAVFRIEGKMLVCAISRKLKIDVKALISISEVSNFLFGRTFFSGLLKVVVSEPPFRDQPYHADAMFHRDHRTIVAAGSKRVANMILQHMLRSSSKEYKGIPTAHISQTVIIFTALNASISRMYSSWQTLNIFGYAFPSTFMPASW